MVLTMLMSKKSRSNQLGSRGFTLIELLVTTALSLILLGGALASYNQFNSQQGHIQSSKQVISDFERAKARAQAGDKPEECDRLDGYRVITNANSTLYIVSAVCNGGSLETASEQFNLSSNYQFDSSVEVVFPVRPASVAASDQIVDIARVNNGQIYRFVIKTNGTIEDQGLVD